MELTELWRESPRFMMCVGVVMQVEAGFANDPDDSGGPTMFGISWNNNTKRLAELGIKRGGMMLLKADDARAIYYHDYWLPATCEDINDPGLALIIFDSAVLDGVYAAREYLHRLSPPHHFYDGEGMKNSHLFQRYVFEIAMARSLHYTHLSKQQKALYLSGWINRLVYVASRAFQLVQK